MKQAEDIYEGNAYRQRYLDSIETLIKTKQLESYEKRTEYAENIIDNQGAYRERFMTMLGWPLTIERPKDINVRITKVAMQRSYDVYRMEFEVFEDFWYYGILFRHRDCKKRPFAISQHGGLGTPELCSGMLGSSSNYNDMTERIIKLGFNVFAPQMLLWDKESYGIDFDRIKIDKELKQLGSSITALEIFCLQIVLDYFEKQDYVDKDNITMAGLSYGGFYTLFCTAIDTRIKRSIASSQYNNRIDYNWADWTWFNAANTFGDAEIAMLVYPRKLTICVGDKDELFDCKSAKKEYEKLKKQTDKYVKEWLNFVVFDGAHEFIKDDDILRKSLCDI